MAGDSPRQRAHKFFSILDFISPSAENIGSKTSAQAGVKYG